MQKLSPGPKGDAINLGFEHLFRDKGNVNTRETMLASYIGVSKWKIACLYV